MSKLPIEHSLRTYFPYGFPVSREAFERFDLTSLMDRAEAASETAGFQAVRVLTQQINKMRHHETYEITPLKSEELIFLSLIMDVLRFMTRRYFFQDNPGVLTQGVKRCEDQLGEEDVAKLPPAFVQLFPSRKILSGWQNLVEFLDDQEEGIANRDVVITEVLLLYLTIRNPATGPLRELFDDIELQRRSPYVPFVISLEEFCEEQPPFGDEGMSLFHFLRAPMHASPDSLVGQLNYIQVHWSKYLPATLRKQLVLAQDIWREDQRLRGLGPGQVPVLEFGRWQYEYPEPERFSEDKNWMSNVVLMAKNIHVWIDQLAKIYQRNIRILSDIPDEELDRLARWGFRGLWLIGVWERSPASQKIKQYMGNPEAAASAYSLHDYSIAADLGGEEAYQNLRDRAWVRGIRLASDMVPNHMGVDSRWIMEHPDWFIQLPHPPYPWYSFTGGDLSSNEKVALFIEDGYWEHRDAAVVFKRIDKGSGDTRYIYHGNDGTSMPWNDTAQLNYLLPEVREAVIHTILQVARSFPIIRFDAAMTLAKKHYQRLWFPPPGDAGAIPSRAEHGMTPAQFDTVFPVEFWREVVDRVTQEAPETLLLAEAFWLMEGYFVRTLGMHRVYNSAFMNMLKMEENQKYRQTIKNVLEFSPEVLKRFVNFMSNPDERTAIEQFGKGDKYYGVAVLLVTMPGLPMFGHGQVEGLTEKYGMEYRKAYWNEPVDEHMVWRHEQEIFPLMRRRQLFSGADNFAFFDFVAPDGLVDENVFAYTNRTDNERALIIYNNAFSETRGRIHTSTPINLGKGSDTHFVQRNLAEALTLNTSNNCWYAFRDYRTGMEYLRTGREFAAEGLAILLHAYQYHAFLDFREIWDTDGSWASLAGILSGRGVPSIDEAHQEMLLEPILLPLEKALNAGWNLVEEQSRINSAPSDPVGKNDHSISDARKDLEQAVENFFSAVASYIGVETYPAKTLVKIVAELDFLLSPRGTLQKSVPSALPVQAERINADIADEISLARLVVAWAILHRLGEIASPEKTEDSRTLSQMRIQDWLIQKKIHAGLSQRDHDENQITADSVLFLILVHWSDIALSDTPFSPAQIADRLFTDNSVREYLLVNKHAGSLWFNKERFERMLQALSLVATAELHMLEQGDVKKTAQVNEFSQVLLDAADTAGYRLEETIAILQS